MFFSKRSTTPLEAIQEKANAYNAALEEAQASLDAAVSKRDEAKVAMETASDANDADAFAAAKHKFLEAETSIEMLTMRRDRIMEKGIAPKAEADAAVKDYIQQIRALDTETCAEILRQIEALNTLVHQRNEEAKTLYWDLDKLCRLLNRDFPDGYLSGRNSERYLYAADFLNSQIILANVAYFNRLRKTAGRS